MSRSRKPAVLRGFAASSLAVFVALACHVSSGGAMPGPLGVAVPWILAFMVCTLLAGRKLSALRLSLSVAISQMLFHALFVLGAFTPSGAFAGHVHGATSTLPSGAPLEAALAADTTMWSGHALAAAVTILALHRGERMLLLLRTLSRSAILWVRRRLSLPIGTLRAPRRPRISPLRIGSRLPSAPWLRAVQRRGPPLPRTV